MLTHRGNGSTIDPPGDRAAEASAVLGRPLDQPSAENSPPGAVRAAVVELSERTSRDPATGRWVCGNVGALRHGGRSLQLRGALEDAKAELLRQVQSDLALDETAAVTLASLADAYCEATLLRRSLFQRLAVEGGAVTGRGRTRQSLGVYLQVLDRELRLAATLGLERRTKPVSPLDALRSAVEAASDPDTTPPPLTSTSGPTA